MPPWSLPLLMVGSWGRGRWVFVKKKAPLGRKAERKWRIADLGLELILRAKKAAAAEADASAAEVSVLQGSEGVCSRSFVVVTHSGAAEVARSLLRGGIALSYARLPFCCSHAEPS